MTISALPTPRFPDPRQSPVLNWAVLAPGNIANSFVTALHKHTDQRAVAVGSSNPERAAEFAARHSITKSYGSYEATVSDPAVDAVYIASPHSHHLPLALLAIAAGKHVLVEKSITQNAAEARELVVAARNAKVLLMEALWTRYLPHIDILRQLIAGGDLGDLRFVSADFGFNHVDGDPTGRLLNPALAGGAMLDLGIYPANFAEIVFEAAGHGLLTEAKSQVAGIVTPTGVDGHVSMQLETSAGAHAQLLTSLMVDTPCQAQVLGSKGQVYVDRMFFCPTGIEFRSGGTRLRWDENLTEDSGGLAYEAAHFARLVSQGALESDLHSLAATVDFMDYADQVRRDLGTL